MADNNFDPYENLQLAADSEIRDLRVGDQWYDMGAETKDGELIAYFPEKNKWEQVGDIRISDYDFFSTPTWDFYRHPYSYAEDHNETEKWDSSENLIIQCKKDLEKTVNLSFDSDFNTVDVNALNDVLNRYGVERTAFVLAKSINTNPEDKNVSMENRSWAVAVDAYFGDLDYSFGLNNVLILPPKSLNAATDLFKMETHYDPTMYVMNTDFDPYPFVYPFTYNIAEFNNELPEYLWSWRKNCKCADAINDIVDPDRGGHVESYMRSIIQEYGTDRVSVVLGSTLNLYASRPDISDQNKEWLKSVKLPATNIPEISGYLIQASALDLDKFLNKCLPVLQLEIDMGKEAEDTVLNGSPISNDKYFFGIYQDPYAVGITKNIIEGNAGKADFSGYKSVYSAEEKGWTREGSVLNDIYDQFLDGRRPAGFTGYPLSLGDIIVLNHNGAANAFIINATGFEELPGFVQVKREENDLTRQNNSLDEPDGHGAR